MKRVLLGDALDSLKSLPKNSVHFCVTDPPYFIDGLGDTWNQDKVAASQTKAGVVGGLPVGMKFDPEQGKRFQSFMLDISKEIYRVLVPGAFYVSFSQARLYHRLGVAVEDAGFELRDMLAWKYEGQAKAFSQDHFVRKMKITEAEKARILADLGGRKTPQLKPQIEPMTLAQKPRDGTFVENWLQHRTGLVDVAQTLDGMFPGNVMEVKKPTKDEKNKGVEGLVKWASEDRNRVMECLNALQKDMSGAMMLLQNGTAWNMSLYGSSTTDQFLKAIRSIIEIMSATTTASKISNYSPLSNTSVSIPGAIETMMVNGLSLAKLVEFTNSSAQVTTNAKMASLLNAVAALLSAMSHANERARRGNDHVTVKPVKLISHLIKLFSTEGQVVLDPFLGSGSHGVAAIECGRSFIGIEREPHYYEIAKKRIDGAAPKSGWTLIE